MDTCNACWGLPLLSEVWIFEVGKCNNAPANKSESRSRACSHLWGMGRCNWRCKKKIQQHCQYIGTLAQRNLMSGSFFSFRWPLECSTSLETPSISNFCACRLDRNVQSYKVCILQKFFAYTFSTYVARRTLCANLLINASDKIKNFILLKYVHPTQINHFSFRTDIHGAGMKAWHSICYA